LSIPLAGRQLSLLVLLCDRLLGGRMDRLVAKLPQLSELVLVGLGELPAHADDSMAAWSRILGEALDHRGIELPRPAAARRPAIAARCAGCPAVPEAINPSHSAGDPHDPRLEREPTGHAARPRPR